MSRVRQGVEPSPALDTDRLPVPRSNLRIFSSLAEIGTAIPPTVPKLVLTVPSTLSYGYSRALFLDFAQNPLNLVLLTGLSEPGTLARWLAKEIWEPQQEAGSRYGRGKVGTEVKMERTIELEVSSLDITSRTHHCADAVIPA